MDVIWFLLVGFLAGLLARALVPGKDAMSVIQTTLLGVVGSFIGGVLVVLFTDRDFNSFAPTKIVGSVVGAIVALLIYRRMKS